MGPDAKAATQPLLEMLKDKDQKVRWDAIRALQNTGPAIAIPVLMDQIQGNDEQARQTAAQAWGDFGELLRHKDDEARRKAAEVLGKIGFETEVRRGP